jgi:repressor LexA
VTAAVVVPLTAVQERILHEIRTFAAEYGHAPSLRELSDLCGRGLSTIAYQVQQLEAKGWIRRAPGRSRALVVLDPANGAA